MSRKKGSAGSKTNSVRTLTILSKHGIIFLLAESSGNREEVIDMEWLDSFIISVIAGVVTYYICKWLDEDGPGDK